MSRTCPPCSSTAPRDPGPAPPAAGERRRARPRPPRRARCTTRSPHRTHHHARRACSGRVPLLALLEQRLELVRHLWQRLTVDLDHAAALAQYEVDLAPLRVGGRVVVTGMPAAALLAREGGSGDALRDGQHRP